MSDFIDFEAAVDDVDDNNNDIYYKDDEAVRGSSSSSNNDNDLEGLLMMKHQLMTILRIIIHLPIWIGVRKTLCKIRFLTMMMMLLT